MKTFKIAAAMVALSFTMVFAQGKCAEEQKAYDGTRAKTQNAIRYWDGSDNYCCTGISGDELPYYLRALSNGCGSNKRNVVATCEEYEKKAKALLDECKKNPAAWQRKKDEVARKQKEEAEKYRKEQEKAEKARVDSIAKAKAVGEAKDKEIAEKLAFFTDSRDGKSYKYVKIGEQTWMAENLNYEASGSVRYDNKYGRLYDWNTATEVCPSGWHLPSKEEWEELAEAVGGFQTMGKHLKAMEFNGDNTYGFSVLPSGYGGYTDDKFREIGESCILWTSSGRGDKAYNYKIEGNEVYNSNNYKYFKFSVRCVQDSKEYVEKRKMDFNIQLSNIKENVSFASFKGKPLMIYYFGPRCPHCIRDYGGIQQIAKEYEQKGLVSIAVSIRDADKKDLLKFIEQQKAAIPFLQDAKGEFGGQYGDGYIPKLYLVHPDGNTVSYIQNNEPYVEHLKAGIDRILDPSKIPSASQPVAQQSTATGTAIPAQAAAKSEANKVVQQVGFTDTRDGKKYPTAKIGNQTWMAENLNYATGNSKCYDNNPANCEKYGRLYDWETAKNACPSGWHLPSEAEWDALEKAVGGSKTVGRHLKAKSGWNENKKKSGNGDDTYGFAALPGGYFTPPNPTTKSKFGSIGERGFWWSATELSTNPVPNAIRRRLDHDSEIFGTGFLGAKYDSKTELFSVRCVMD